MKIVILGLSITSSWGNGHAATYRGLMRELTARGHDVLFLERDVPWYSSRCDLPRPPYGRTILYEDLQTLKDCYTTTIRRADLVLVGSSVPEGIEIGKWVTNNARGMTAFYDLETPVTLAKLARGDATYLSEDLIPRYQLYLSSTGGPALYNLEHDYGAQAALPFYAAIDSEVYYPDPQPVLWDLGYMGRYAVDRQVILDHLMLDAARYWQAGRFIIVGAQYPGAITWPRNVEHVEHLLPVEHREFYNAQRFALNVTRADMIRAGYSPSVRLFEAAACGVPIISDYWEGLETFFEPGSEILIARSAAETLRYLRELPDEERAAIGQRARDRVLASHTTAQRVEELERYVGEKEAL